jgi:hypothetical protein
MLRIPLSGDNPNPSVVLDDPEIVEAAHLATGRVEVLCKGVRPLGLNHYAQRRSRGARPESDQLR